MRLMQRAGIIFFGAMFMSLISSVAVSAQKASAVFAAGCFWCAEHDFEKIKGVFRAIPGYTGGELKNPTYEEVSSGKTKHIESIKVIYNPQVISYKQLLNVFWRNVDPIDESGQFCDKGDQYRSAIFYANQDEKKAAEQSKNALLATRKFKSIATLIIPQTQFYPAENYHQHYAKKNPVRYNYYRYRCGRDKRLKEIWGS